MNLNNQSCRFSTEAAARYLGISVPLLKKLRRFNKGPSFIRISRRIVYDVADLDAYLASQRQVTEEAGK